MSSVQTLRGPIDSSQLGFTLMHEHIFTGPEGLHENFPSLWDKQEQVASARKQLTELYNLGVHTLVDQTIFGLGRNIPLILETAGDLPINIIVTTGIYHYYDVVHIAFQFQDVDEMTDLFVRDIQDGIQGTGVRAGVVKGATGDRGITPFNEKTLRAAARAHRRTGVPIYTHSESKTRQGLEQQDVFEKEGVDLTRVVIGHTGDTEDIDYMKQIMDRGSFIGIDRIGIDAYLPTAQRVSLISRLCDMGYAGQMVLSHDRACYWTHTPWNKIKDFGQDWSYFHISRNVIPALLESGVSRDQVRQMTVENSRCIFENMGTY